MKTALKKFFSYDKSLSVFEGANGTISMSQIFVPFFIELLLLNTMGTINTLMLSHYSDDAVAAVGAASQLTGMILTLYTVISTGASIVINHNLGAGNTKTASDAAFTSIVFCTAFSFFLGTMLSVFAKPVLGLMHLEEHILDYATVYFKIVIQFSFLQAFISSISSIFRSYGRPKVSVCISLFMNILVALFDYLILFRPIEIPLKGISGIAIGYVLSQVMGLIFILLIFIRLPLGLKLHTKNLSTLKNILTILRIGIPGGISSLSYNLSQVVSTSIIAILGTAAISTKIYVSNIVFYVYVLGLSLGTSTSLLISWMSGAGQYEKAYRLNLQSLKITVFINLALSLSLFCFGRPLLSLFTSDPEILAMGKTLMLIDILVEIGRGFNHIEENSLRGAGDVVYPMVIAITSCWVMSIFFSWFLGVQLKLGLAGCWIAFAMDELFRAVAYFIRWHSRKWVSKTI